MEFDNLTPFEARAFNGFDTRDRAYHVIAMAVGYQLSRQSDGGWQARVMDDEPVALCMSDVHAGDPATSTLLRESDMIPYKPRCDVLVIGHSFAPRGQAAREWTARLRLTKKVAARLAEPRTPEPLNPLMGLTEAQRTQWQCEQAAHRAQIEAALNVPPTVILDKTLLISGPSQFTRRPFRGYRRSRRQTATAVPLSYALAWGGHCRVDDPKNGSALINEVCLSNPIGCGWIEKRWFKALRKARLARPKAMPAPQIERPGESRLTTPFVVKHPKGELDARAMARIAREYGRTPAGFGPLGKAWAPRLSLAGTYDQRWLDERHPRLPEDFNFGYWNSAPPDQRIDFPDLTDQYRLVTDNLVPGGGPMAVDLPPHRALVLADLGGLNLPFAMQIDTMILDTDSLVLTTVWRTAMLQTLEPERIEARFISDPAAPWLPWRPIDDEAELAT